MMELEQPFTAPNIGAIEEKEKQLLRELQVKYGDQSGVLAKSRTSSVILGFPKENKRKQKEQKKEGSVISGTGKSVASNRTGKHKEVHCKVPKCGWNGRSDLLKTKHIKKHSKEEIKQYF